MTDHSTQTWKHPPRKRQQSPWLIAGWVILFFALMAFAVASAAVGGKAIEKAAFYQVNSERGW